MVSSTEGIVLRSVKYGDTSLITTIFTRVYGVQSYLLQGVRSSKTKGNKAGMLQPATILDIVTDRKPGMHLQRLKEYHFGHLYSVLQEDVVKNTIALFSVELLLRLLPENADQPDLFDFCITYFKKLDEGEIKEIANFPLFFIIHCGRQLGYYIHGSFTDATPYVSIEEGSFSSHPDRVYTSIDASQSLIIDKLNKIEHLPDVSSISINSHTRFTLLEWYIHFLKVHTQHLGNIKSLAVLQAILH